MTPDLMCPLTRKPCRFDDCDVNIQFPTCEDKALSMAREIFNRGKGADLTDLKEETADFLTARKIVPNMFIQRVREYVEEMKRIGVV